MGSSFLVLGFYNILLSCYSTIKYLWNKKPVITKGVTTPSVNGSFTVGIHCDAWVTPGYGRGDRFPSVTMYSNGYAATDAQCGYPLRNHHCGDSNDKKRVPFSDGLLSPLPSKTRRPLSRRPTAHLSTCPRRGQRENVWIGHDTRAGEQIWTARITLRHSPDRQTNTTENITFS